MCQYGAYGLAKMGVKYGEIIKHYYTGVDLTKAY
jgi:stage II sporulation protein D